MVLTVPDEVIITCRAVPVARRSAPVVILIEVAAPWCQEEPTPKPIAPAKGPHYGALMANLSPLRRLCGQLIVGGFDGDVLPDSYRDALAAGERGGAILFRRNISTLDQTASLCRAVREASGASAPPFIAVDQEGGRVSRLPAPFTVLPAMRVLGDINDVELTAHAGKVVANELRALGFNLNFAPVMDVDSNPDNPIIGDRAFGHHPRAVMRHGIAFLRGLQDGGVLACAKHYPGHGDTDLDSHLALPTVKCDEMRLTRVELPPFRAASGAGVAAMMTAHVVYPAWDEQQPATFSRVICTRLLRREIGFEGVLFSDDLEMGAIANHHGVGEAAVEAIWAGCDVLLICKDETLQEQALKAMVDKAQGDDAFRARCEQAYQRAQRVRKLIDTAPTDDWRSRVGGRIAQQLLADIARAMAAPKPAASTPRAITPANDAAISENASADDAATDGTDT